ncbi:MAG: RecQ family ATP-dependent DNA helicase [Flavobacteriales bacterium]|jgi:RecQ family ATP-dependent DNA helicase|nr:RecQ family ATP-dependent DNA helicase [Flavobacteriales bacterium]HQV76007.1 RecQ family ATP-dependent DNA helicase [Flavobacteriales bacterium]
MSGFHRQLIAGAFSDVVIDAVRVVHKDTQVEATKDMLLSLSYFETDISDKDNTISLENPRGSVVAILHNLIQRGKPTRASTFLEEYLKLTWGGIDHRQDPTGTVCYRAADPSKEFVRDLFDALCIVDPRIGAEPIELWAKTKELGSDLEKQFVERFLSHLGSPCLLQVLELQRSLTNILTYAYESGERIEDLQSRWPFDRFGRQRVDFSIELPRGREGQKKGLVLEIDGSQHSNPAQEYLDGRRDEVLGLVKNVNWSVLRLKSGEAATWGKRLDEHNGFFEDKYLKQLRANYDTPIYARPAGLRALSIALTPLAVARIQRVLVELLLKGTLSLDAEVWRIGILERDVDCGLAACRDFESTLGGLFVLAGVDSAIPRIDLTTYDTTEFRCLNTAKQSKQPFEAVRDYDGDVLLDVSVLQRWGLSEPVKSKARITVTVRSAHSKSVQRRFLSARPITYPSLATVHDDRTDVDLPRIAVLRNLMRSVFRKANFREGQLPIISKALGRNSIVGLLPTGGGKSITYQLCTLIQPGHTMVVDPIKSLMEDQDEGLKRNWIDATVFVNSNLNQFERAWAQDQVLDGNVLLSFVSPERFMIERFRSDMGQMQRAGKFFCYCVIDEAHCVSEWGHDFRTAYLRLGENARKCCSTWTGDTVPLFGLTATASFDVLTDVRRELEIPKDHVVESLSIQRSELCFGIHGVPEKSTSRETVARAKLLELNALLAALPDLLAKHAASNNSWPTYLGNDLYERDDKDKYRNGILVFCPHASGKLGVEAIASGINPKFGAVGTFRGGDSGSEGSARNQRLFLNNDINILVATKAFGMGIDKPNVRATIHIGFPSSIESFVQEAGRAGRDRNPAYCAILYSNASDFDEEIVAWFHEQNFKGAEGDTQMLRRLITEVKASYGNGSSDQRAGQVLLPFAGRDGNASEQDTFKAIHRLGILGLLDDYEVDYNAKAVRAYSSKRGADYYVTRFREYLSLYLSPRRVEGLMRSAEGERLDLANTLIKYVYDNIALKRGRAIKEMRRICDRGLTDPDGLSRALQLHFTSKYYHPMMEDTEDGRSFGLPVLEKYMKLTDGSTDLLEHLRGSCGRILADNPRNGAVLMLSAYAVFLLETRSDSGRLQYRNEKLFTGALEDLETGLEEYLNSGIDPMVPLGIFQRDVLSHASYLDQVLEDLVVNQNLKKQTRWIRAFNKRYYPEHVNN